MTINGKAVVAHRGGGSSHVSGPSLTPENSRAAIKNALAAGINWLEVDARLTRDGQVVIFHDTTLGRTTNGCGFVRRLSLRQLRHYRLANGETVPTLAEVLTLVAGRANLWIDIKGGRRTAEAIVRTVQAKDAEQSVVMSSIRPWVLRHIHRLSDTIRTNLFALVSLYKVWLAKRLGAQFVQPRFLLTKRFLARAKREQIHVINWPVHLPWQKEIDKAFLVDDTAPAIVVKKS